MSDAQSSLVNRKEMKVSEASHRSGDVEISAFEFAPLPLPTSFDGHEIFALFSFRLRGVRFNHFALMIQDKGDWMIRQSANIPQQVAVLPDVDAELVKQAALDAIEAYFDASSPSDPV